MATRATVQPGDVVRLEPDWPQMRVLSVDGRRALCEWSEPGGPRHMVLLPLSQCAGNVIREAKTEKGRGDVADAG